LRWSRIAIEIMPKPAEQVVEQEQPWRMDVTFSYPPQWTDVPAEPHDPEFSTLTQVNQMFPSWKRINE
jgi:hypothetical protein